MERYELINGRKAKTNFQDGERVSSVMENSCFWSSDDSAWFEVVHKNEGVTSRMLALRNPDASYINYYDPDKEDGVTEITSTQDVMPKQPLGVIVVNCP
jgi:hypothetical protein